MRIEYRAKVCCSRVNRTRFGKRTHTSNNHCESTHCQNKQNQKHTHTHLTGVFQHTHTHTHTQTCTHVHSHTRYQTRIVLAAEIIGMDSWQKAFNGWTREIDLSGEWCSQRCQRYPHSTEGTADTCVSAGASTRTTWNIIATTHTV
jgi:hypothetical protein